MDAALWEQLTSSLRTALSARGEEIVSSPPAGPANKVNDLTATRETNGDFTLSWHYRNLGDYDQNGVVGVSDITPLAQHFGETYDAQTGSDSIQAVIDGSGNAKIGVEDVTQIAQNFGVAVAKYSVQGSDAYAGPFAETAIVGVHPQVSDARKVLIMNIGASPQGYWQVIPQDAENVQGEPSNIAGIALEIRSVTPMEVKEGTVVTFSADVLSAGPFTYEWDFGGQAVPATSTEASPKVVLTRDTGGFPARLTVTNHLGNTAYPFTLTKLAREWKYEVVLSTDKDSETVQTRSLCEYEGTVYFNVSLLDTGTSVARYLVSGNSGSWNYESIDWSADNLRISSGGNLGVMRYTGPFLDWTLSFTEKTSGQWNIETVQTSLTLGSCDFVYSRDDVPFVAYLYRYWEPETTVELHYAWRFEDQWSCGLVDDAGGPGGEVVTPIIMQADMAGNPAIAYRLDVDGRKELVLARWDPVNEDWRMYRVGVTPGPWFDFAFNPQGDSCFIFTDYGSTTEELAVRYGTLIGDVFNSEVVQEWPKAEVLNALSSFTLAYDPLGNPVVAAYVGNGLGSVWWYNGASWDVANEIPKCYSRPGMFGGPNELDMAISTRGTPYITYCSIEPGANGPREVILARYE